MKMRPIMGEHLGLFALPRLEGNMEILACFWQPNINLNTNSSKQQEDAVKGTSQQICSHDLVVFPWHCRLSLKKCKTYRVRSVFVSGCKPSFFNE
jgi:hypothetical protein